MKELSLNILDIAENSLKAGASLTKILLTENDESLTIEIVDNGSGMPEETLLSVTNPFYTTRTTRNVGLGIPLFKMAAEQTGGRLEIKSKMRTDDDPAHGTSIKASFNKRHLDFTPLGDITSTIVTLIQGHPDSDFFFSHTKGDKNVTLDTSELRAVLDDVPLDSIEILNWIKDSLREQYEE